MRVSWVPGVGVPSLPQVRRGDSHSGAGDRAMLNLD